MGADDLGKAARQAVLEAICKAALKVGNSPAGIRDLAEAYALVERDLHPMASAVRKHT